MSTAILKSLSATTTKRIGARFSRILKVGDTVLLFGNLGAGKTTFVQGMAKGLGVRDQALSPTFIVAQTLSGRIPIHHLDFYRMTPKELFDMGVEDYLLGQGAIKPGVILIEWPQRCRSIWPKERLEVHLKLGRRANQRSIKLVGRGKRPKALIAKWKKAIA